MRRERERERERERDDPVEQINREREMTEYWRDMVDRAADGRE